MNSVKLIYFEGCPNSKYARAALLRSGVSFDVIIQNNLSKDDPLKRYSSPTILRGEEVLLGSATEGNPTCSYDGVNEDDLIQKLSGQDPHKTRKGLFATIGSFGSALTVGFCPVCIPAVGAFLSSIGLGFLASEIVLKPVLVAFLILALSGFLWSYLKEHGSIAPLLLGLVASIFLYVGRYVFIGGAINTIIMYSGIIGIIGASVWNLYLRRKPSCGSCNS